MRVDWTSGRSFVVGSLVAMLTVAGAVVQDVGADETGRDPSLVLHYTFDYPPTFDNSGKTVIDKSGHNNHGQLHRIPESLRVVDGREGVMRFGGVETFIECGADESLYFNGDMTFEMWVKRHGLIQAEWALLFGDDYNFTFGYQSGQNLRLWYSGDLGGMIEPIENDFITDRWAHIAVVVEYPRCRFYKDGKLVRDLYMPMEGMQQVRNATTWIAGRPGSGGCPVDIDEVRAYRRALTAEEVAAHANDLEVATPVVDELSVDPFWYEDRLSVRLSCKGSDYAGYQAEVLLLDGDYVKKIAKPQAVDLQEYVEGCGRYVGSADFPLRELGRTSVDVRVNIRDRSGRVVKTLRRHASLRKSEWVDNHEGYSDVPVGPYTPLQAKTVTDGAEIDVWGRTLMFGAAPFPTQIVSAGEDLLTGPIALTGRVNGSEISWRSQPTSLVDSSQVDATLTQKSSAGPLTLNVDTIVEYDGYAIFDCVVEARDAVSLDELTLSIPLDSRYASLCLGMYVYPKDRDVPMAQNFSGAVDGDLSFKFSPNVWLGSEDRGLCWQSESNQYWHNADPLSVMDVLSRGQTTTLRARFIDAPKKLAVGDKLHYKFALLGTPMKPIGKDSWEIRTVRSDPYGEDLNLPTRKTEGKPTLEFYKDAGIGHLFYQAHDLCPYPLPVTEGFGDALRNLVESTHAAGLKLYPYLFHQRFPVTAPEFENNGKEMLQLPLVPWAWGGVRSPPNYQGYHSDIFTDYGAKAQGVVIFCNNSKSATDAYIYALAKRFDEFGEDGVYLDGTGFTDPCSNTLHGCGYVGEDGHVHPTYPVFGAHDFCKRIYTTIKQRRPDAVVDHHQSQGQNTASLAWGDMLWTGEHWWHLRETGAPDGYIAGEMKLDLFRTEFMGYPQGIAAETLSYRLGPRMKVCATSLLHDIPVRVRTQDSEYLNMFTKLWKVREQLGYDVTKHFYWNNQDVVEVAPADCYSTLIESKSNGVLAFISNLSRERQDVTVRLHLEKLGLSLADLEVFNPLTDETVPVTADGSITVPLGSEEWIYVWLRPR